MTLLSINSCDKMSYVGKWKLQICQQLKRFGPVHPLNSKVGNQEIASLFSLQGTLMNYTSKKKKNQRLNG